MSQLTITCPSCNETFSADQALQNHLKTVSVSLFVLFLINTVLSVPRFQSPEKIDLTNLAVTNPTELVSTIFLIFGMNTGFLTVLAISIMVMTFVILKKAEKS